MLLQELRYGLRLLVRTPGFTMTAILALALGVGANTSIFGLVNAIFFRPLPVEEPSSLVWISERSPERQRTFDLSYPDYIDYRQLTNVFSGMTAYHTVPMALAGDG